MDLVPFLAGSAAIDSDHPSVRQLAKSIRRENELATVRTAYELVRDRFAHSYDIGAAEVSVSASDVIRHGHGICLPLYCGPTIFRLDSATKSLRATVRMTQQRAACTA